MITYKDLDINELKKDYLTRHGFVFSSSTNSSDRAILYLCDTLIQHNITKEHPEFVVRLDNVTTAFVYKDDFNAPPFFYYADIMTRTGMCKVEQLYNYLK
jgi:hypothetical protein